MKVVPLPHLMMQRYGVLCHGCFDLVHIGHIRYFEWARSLLRSGPLIVTLTADRFIDKGKGRPAFPQDVRAEWLAALECVDFVSIVDAATAVPAIEYAHPAFYAKGENVDKDGERFKAEAEAVEKFGGRVEIQKGNNEYSSTAILTGAYLNGR